jgi:hypothetical protein
MLMHDSKRALFVSVAVTLAAGVAYFIARLFA